MSLSGAKTNSQNGKGRKCQPLAFPASFAARVQPWDPGPSGWKHRAELLTQELERVGTASCPHGHQGHGVGSGKGDTQAGVDKLLCPHRTSPVISGCRSDV